jgi:hypothetical protein
MLTEWNRIAADTTLARREQEVTGLILVALQPIPACADTRHLWPAAVAYFNKALQNLHDNPAQAAPVAGYAAQQGQLGVAAWQPILAELAPYK